METYGATAPFIGGGDGYVSPFGFSERMTDIYPENAKDLALALKSVTAGNGIWIPDGVNIDLGTALYGKVVPKGTWLAGNRGKYRIKSRYDTSDYMTPVLYSGERSVISGITLEGPRGLGHVGPCGPCAIQINRAKNAIVEDFEIFNFSGGGIFVYHDPGITVWNDDTQRAIVRHGYIHNIQRHGYGYGVGIQGGFSSVLIEAVRFGACRHAVMNAGGDPSYEVRECIFEDSEYNTADNGSGTWYGSHQIDAHGGGYRGFRAGQHLYVHHNTLSLNQSRQPKPNICIRGKVGSEAIIEYNWTKKPLHSSPPEFSETESGMFVMLAGEEGGPWDGPDSLLATANVICRRNWYGYTPPNNTDPPPIDVNSDIKATKLEAPAVLLGQPYTITATATNRGDAAGSAVITIGWINSKGVKVSLTRKTVTLEPGASEAVEHTGNATKLGSWTFYCGNLEAVLKVTEEPPAAAVFELTGISAAVVESSVAITATIKNTGNAEGTATVKVGGVPATVAVPAGEEGAATVNVLVELA